MTRIQVKGQGGSGGVTDHGVLTGLADDDHPQYATDTDLTNHATDTTAIHGIGDTGVLETTTGAATKVSNHEAAVNPHPTYLTQAEGDSTYEVTGAVATHAAAGNPHPTYATDTDLANHEADTTAIHGITNTAVLATATDVSSAVTTHAGAADPHTGYQKESEKSQASGYASLDAGTKVPTVELGGVGADNTKFLRGDQTWQVPSGGSGGGNTLYDLGLVR